MRDLFNKKPKYQTITQGSIITGCVAEGVTHDSSIWGCVITARCDMANRKVKKVHYLPIIHFDDWIKSVLLPCLREEWSLSLKQSLSNSLKNNGLSPAFLERNLSRSDLESIIEGSFSKKASKSFWHDYDAWTLSNTVSLKDIADSNQGLGILKNEIKRLINNENSSYYLIEDWRTDSSSSFMVIMLRDIRTIMLDCALNLPNGICEDEVDDSFFLYNSLSKSAEKANIYYVDTEIKSPFIEHIIQRFSNNFLRIGVEDLPKAMVLDSLVEHSKNIIC